MKRLIEKLLNAKQVTNVKEAHELTLQMVHVLGVTGIDIIIRQPRIVREDLEDLKRVKREYPNLDADSWRNVCFMPKNSVQRDKIYEVKKLLSDLEISFDSGGGNGCMDWELDWSFSWKKYNSKDINEKDEILKYLTKDEILKDLTKELFKTPEIMEK